MRTCTSLIVFLLCLLGGHAFASPNSLTYQGRIIKSDGTPLEYNNVSFLFEITNPSGNCVLYREQRNTVNMMNSGGVFDVPIGTGTKLFPTDPLFTLLDSFNNAKVQNCDGGATYTPAEGDIRLLKVQFHDGVGWKAISPSSEIRSVPYAAFSLAAEKLGSKTENDFIAKALIPTCAAGTFLSWDGSSLACNPVSGASGGTVTSVSSTNSYVTIANGNSTPQITLNVGSSANTVAAGDDPRLSDARPPIGSAGGDLSGSYPNPGVAKIQGAALNITTPAANDYLKYSGSQWVNSAIAISDVTNLSATLTGYHTIAAFNTAVGSANCNAYEAPYWSSVSGKFLCQAINVSLAGDASGPIGTVSVDKLKGVPVGSTAPTTGQVLKYDGTKWAPGTDNDTGTVTSVSGTTPINVSSGTTTPVISINQATTSSSGYLSAADWNTFNGKQAAGNYITALTGDVTATGPGSVASNVAKLQGNTLTLTTPANKDYLKFNGTAFINSPLASADLSGTIPAANMPAFSGDVTSSAGTTVLSLPNVGTANTYYKVTTDAKGRVTSGATSLMASDIPALDWTKITTGKPTTLAGYGITDSLVSNAGGTPSLQTGLDASKPATPAAGAIYFATDSKVIYQYNSGTWISIASANTNLNTGVTGTLPIANGGTGQTTALAAFNALSPLSTKGDLLSFDGTNNLRLSVGVNGQVLSADSTQASGLKWITPNSGTVTNVTGTAPIVVSNGTTTPAISVSDATTAAKGVVQVGAGIAVSAGTISADPANFPSIVPIAKGGTGASSMTGNRLVASNGTGSAYTPFTCALGQTITFDASGIPGCSSFTAAGLFMNGGNSFGAAASLGTNDANPLSFRTNNSVAMTIDTAGDVGIGTATPNASSLLELSSTTKGFLPPRMTSAQRDAIATPAAGLVIYNTTTGQHEYFNGSLWGALGATAVNPAGLVASFSMASCPAGWLEANGAAVSRTTYASLYSAIGVIYGNGDGSTTFNLPDYRGYFLRGWNHGSGNDPDASGRTNRGDGTTGDSVGTKQAYQIQSHDHPFTDGAAWRVSGGSGSPYGGTGGGNWNGATNPPGVVGFNGGNETRPKNVNVIYCISTATVTATSIASSGSGTAGYIPKWTSSVALGNSSIFDNGNVGIGTATPAAKLDIAGSAQFGGNKGYIGYYNVNPYDQAELGAIGSTTSLSLVTNSVSRLNITPTGNVGIGTTTPGATLDVNGSIKVGSSTYNSDRIYFSSSYYYIVNQGSTVGVYLQNGATSWGAQSDRRLKHDIQPVTEALSKLNQITGVTYNYNVDEPGIPRRVGVIAQDVEKVLPEAVSRDEKGYLFVRYSELVPLTINATKELYGLCKASEGQLKSLSEKVQQHDQDIAALRRDLASVKEQARKFEKENAALRRDLELIKKKLGL